MKNLTNEQLIVQHEKLREILIDYGNEEYGDVIIDEICVLFNYPPTTVYYEKEVSEKKVREDLEFKLQGYSVDELTTNCRENLKLLKNNSIENKHVINYYEKFWKLLSEY